MSVPGLLPPLGLLNSHVVIKHRDAEDLLGPVLPDNEAVEVSLQRPRRQPGRPERSPNSTGGLVRSRKGCTVQPGVGESGASAELPYRRQHSAGLAPCSQHGVSGVEVNSNGGGSLSKVVERRRDDCGRLGHSGDGDIRKCEAVRFASGNGR